MAKNTDKNEETVSGDRSEEVTAGQAQVIGAPIERTETEEERLRRENGAQGTAFDKDEPVADKRERWAKFQSPNSYEGVSAEPAVAPNTEPLPKTEEAPS